MGESYIAHMRRRAITTFIIGAAIYAAGVAAIPLVGHWDSPSWYESLQDLKGICDASRVPTERSCGAVIAPSATLSEGCCSSPPQGDLAGRVRGVRAAIAKAEDHVPYWFRTRAMVAHECARSLRRQCQLISALDDPGEPPFSTGNPQFSTARKLLDEERARFAQLADQEHSLEIGRYDIAVRIGFGVVDIILAWLAISLLARGGRSSVPGGATEERARVVERWTVSFAVFTAIGILATLAMLCGSIDADDKLWIGADSWVVSKAVWFCNLGSIIGIAVVFAAPITLLWQLGQPAFIPEQLKLDDPDGQCGVGAYVSFLHTWTLLAFAFAIVPAIMWIRYLNPRIVSAHPTYLVPVAVGLGLTAVLVGRLVTNATQLRARYRSAVAGSSRTWAEVEANKPPPDPTIPFIGENWWKLPATLGTIVLALWQILEWTGAAHAIADAGGR